MLESVSVVVPTYRRRDRLPRVLDPLLRDPAALEVVVVVDGCDDGTWQLLTRWARDEPRLRPVWQENAGAGAARQAGLERCAGDIVLFVDDDVTPMPGLASGHAAAHAAEPGRVVVGSMPVRLPSRRAPGDAPARRYAVDYEQGVRAYEQDPSNVLMHLWTGNVSIPRQQALRVGMGDDEMEALYFEDRDLGLRLRRAGLQAVYCPNLTAAHEHARTLRGFWADAVRQGKGLRVLHRRYPEVVARPDGRWIAGRLPPPARQLVVASAGHAGLGRAAGRAILLLVWLAGHLRLWSLQDLLLVLLRRLGQAVGVADADGSGQPFRRRSRSAA